MLTTAWCGKCRTVLRHPELRKSLTDCPNCALVAHLRARIMDLENQLRVMIMTHGEPCGKEECEALRKANSILGKEVMP